MSEPDKIDGEGFSQDEFTPAERAKVREWMHHLGNEFLSPQRFLEETGLSGIVKLLQAAPVLVKILAGAAVIGGALRWASSQGLI